MSVYPSDLTATQLLLVVGAPLIFPLIKLSDFMDKIEQSTDGGRVLKAVEYGIPSYNAFSKAYSTVS